MGERDIHELPLQFHMARYFLVNSAKEDQIIVYRSNVEVWKSIRWLRLLVLDNEIHISFISKRRDYDRTRINFISKWRDNDRTC